MSNIKGTAGNNGGVNKGSAVAVHPSTPPPPPPAPKQNPSPSQQTPTPKSNNGR